MKLNRIAAALAVAACFVSVPAGQAGQQKEDEFLKGVYLADTPGLTMPELVKQVFPRYTSDAMRAKIQGQAEVQAVVMPDGSVSRARIVTSVDKIFGLDEEAIAAAKQWRFKAGTLNGQAVPVAVTVTLQFAIH